MNDFYKMIQKRNILINQDLNIEINIHKVENIAFYQFVNRINTIMWDTIIKNNKGIEIYNIIMTFVIERYVNLSLK